MLWNISPACYVHLTGGLKLRKNIWMPQSHGLWWPSKKPNKIDYGAIKPFRTNHISKHPHETTRKAPGLREVKIHGYPQTTGRLAWDLPPGIRWCGLSLHLPWRIRNSPTCTPTGFSPKLQVAFCAGSCIHFHFCCHHTCSVTGQHPAFRIIVQDMHNYGWYIHVHFNPPSKCPFLNQRGLETKTLSNLQFDKFKQRQKKFLIIKYIHKGNSSLCWPGTFLATNLVYGWEFFLHYPRHATNSRRGQQTWNPSQESRLLAHSFLKHFEILLN